MGAPVKQNTIKICKGCGKRVDTFNAYLISDGARHLTTKCLESDPRLSNPNHMIDLRKKRKQENS